MANYRLGGALNAARWPFIAALQGRTVINPIYDVENKVRRGFGGSEESEDNTFPQLMYAENVMPTAEGIASVGYQELVPADGAKTEFDQCMVLRDANEVSYVYSPAGGKNYLLDQATLLWAATNSISPTAGTQVSRAIVNGRIFICYAKTNVYEYKPSLGTITAVALTLPAGIAVGDIISILNSSNYLVLFTATSVYWSSLTDPTNFTVSITTGAGNATPQDIRGIIVCGQSSSGGFIIFTAKNAVAAQYTNNSRAPFIFKEIPGAGGVYRNEQVTADNVSGVQYAWTTDGLQRITLQQAEYLSAEVNDYLAGRMQMVWDPPAMKLTSVPAGGTEFAVKVTLVSNRFLCISYADDAALVPTFNYCLVYDLALKRWGQLKITHVDAFPFQVPTNGLGLTFNDLGTQTFTQLGTKTFNQLIGSTVASGNPSSKRMLAFLTATGAIELALMDYQKDFTHNGVAIFGRHQLVRQQMMQHQVTTIEGTYGSEISGTPSFAAYIIPSVDGYNFDQTVPLVKLSGSGKQQVYGKRLTATNFNLAFVGTFALSSYITEVCPAGRS